MKDWYWLGFGIVVGNVFLRPVLRSAGTPEATAWYLYLALFWAGALIMIRALVLSHRRIRESRRQLDAYFGQMEGALTQFEEDCKTLKHEEALARLSERLNELKDGEPPLGGAEANR